MSDIPDLLSMVNENNLVETVQHLQDMHTRRYGTGENIQAGTYLYNRLAAMQGLTVEYKGGEIRNIIATIPGTTNTIFIIGAHYDSISNDPGGYAPGAADNAVGVAIILELARIMSQYSFKHAIILALWNGEEYRSPTDYLVGSEDFARYAKDSTLDIGLYLNCDPTCVDPNGLLEFDVSDRTDIAEYQPGIRATWAADLMVNNNSLYEIGFNMLRNTKTWVYSDHLPFYSRGYYAIQCGAEEIPFKHTIQDVIGNVSFPHARKTAQLDMATLAVLAEIGEIPPPPPPRYHVLTVDSNLQGISFNLRKVAV